MALEGVDEAEELDEDKLENLKKRQKTYCDVLQGFSHAELSAALRKAGNDCPKALLILMAQRGEFRVHMPPQYLLDGSDVCEQQMHKVRVRTSVMRNLGTAAMFKGASFTDDHPVRSGVAKLVKLGSSARMGSGGAGEGAASFLRNMFANNRTLSFTPSFLSRGMSGLSGDTGLDSSPTSASRSRNLSNGLSMETLEEKEEPDPYHAALHRVARNSIKSDDIGITLPPALASPEASQEAADAQGPRKSGKMPSPPLSRASTTGRGSAFASKLNSVGEHATQSDAVHHEVGVLPESAYGSSSADGPCPSNGESQLDIDRRMKRIHNLMRRFPEASRAKIMLALTEAHDHAGLAASILAHEDLHPELAHPEQNPELAAALTKGHADRLVEKKELPHVSEEMLRNLTVSMLGSKPLAL